MSNDNSVLILNRDGRSPALIDSSTGETLASLDPRNRPNVVTVSKVSGDLRYVATTGEGRCSTDLLPLPDTAPPRESLARVLRESGLTLRGAELAASSAD